MIYGDILRSFGKHADQSCCSVWRDEPLQNNFASKGEDEDPEWWEQIFANNGSLVERSGAYRIWSNNSRGYYAKF